MNAFDDYLGCWSVRVDAALDAVLAGRPVPADQKPSIGCNIKWK